MAFLNNKYTSDKCNSHACYEIRNWRWREREREREREIRRVVYESYFKLQYNLFFLRRQLLYDFWSKKEKKRERERENRSTILATTC